MIDDDDLAKQTFSVFKNFSFSKIIFFITAEKDVQKRDLKIASMWKRWRPTKQKFPKVQRHFHVFISFTTQCVFLPSPFRTQKMMCFGKYFSFRMDSSEPRRVLSNFYDLFTWYYVFKQKILSLLCEHTLFIDCHRLVDYISYKNPVCWYTTQLSNGNQYVDFFYSITSGPP